MLSEEHGRTVPVEVNFVEYGLCILLDRCREHDYLVVLTHLVDELFGIRPDIDINGLQVSIQVDGLLNVCIPKLFET